MKALIVKNSLLLALLLIIHQTSADENIESNSNLENFTYPTHTCNKKPLKPKKPGKLSSQEDVETYNNVISKYNINVANYNKEIKTYKTCINEYIQRGNQDINTIRQQLNFSLEEARKRQ